MATIRLSCPLRTHGSFFSTGRSTLHVQFPTTSYRCYTAVGGVRPTDNQSPEVAKLTDEIFEAESKLAALFEPGRPMPRAGTVATMRQEVSELKAKLAAIMRGANPDVVFPAAPETDDELAERARLAFLEVERLIDQKGNGRKAQCDAAAIAILEAENERLRLEATALLLRQQQLEDLIEKHNLTGRRG